MIHASIQWGGDTWEVAIALDNSATITSSRFQRQGTFCGDLLHDFTGRNFVPEQVLGLLGQALGEQASAVSRERGWPSKCIRCGAVLDTDEGAQTGVCPDCWTWEDGAVSDE